MPLSLVALPGFGAPFRLYEHSSVANAGDAKRMPAVATGQSKSLRFMAKRQLLNHSLNTPRCFVILHLKDARQGCELDWFFGQDPSLTGVHLRYECQFQSGSTCERQASSDGLLHCSHAQLLAGVSLANALLPLRSEQLAGWQRDEGRRDSLDDS